MKLVECVPNFSEGRDLEKIKQITDEIRRVPGVILLNVESNPDHNRTVVTFVGSPESVRRAAFLAIAVATQVIDMSSHKGEHPRLGACDVCPFVPLAGVSMEECVFLVQELGKEVGEKLNIPVFLYEEAARKPERKNLSTIRRGEYEGLADKLQCSEWQPDFGPAVFNPKSGAIVIGARSFLIAYNINLNTKDVGIAKKIASLIRESGRTLKYNGMQLKIPGFLVAVKALGVRGGDMAQVSMNLTNFKLTPIYVAYEAVSGLAELVGVDVLESEIVGLVPEEAIMDAGRFYLSEGRCKKEFIDAAIKALKLKEFQPEKKIIEWVIKEKTKEAEDD